VPLEQNKIATKKSRQLARGSRGTRATEGRFGKQDFRYVAAEDIYICPAGEKLAHHFTNEENGLVLPLHQRWLLLRSMIRPVRIP
jgi:hypothetical protein